MKAGHNETNLEETVGVKAKIRVRLTVLERSHVRVRSKCGISLLVLQIVQVRVRGSGC